MSDDPTKQTTPSPNRTWPWRWEDDNDPEALAERERRKQRQLSMVDGILDDYEPALRELAKR